MGIIFSRLDNSNLSEFLLGIVEIDSSADSIKIVILIFAYSDFSQLKFLTITGLFAGKNFVRKIFHNTESDCLTTLVYKA